MFTSNSKLFKAHLINASSIKPLHGLVVSLTYNALYCLHHLHQPCQNQSCCSIKSSQELRRALQIHQAYSQVNTTHHVDPNHHHLHSTTFLMLRALDQSCQMGLLSGSPAGPPSQPRAWSSRALGLDRCVHKSALFLAGQGVPAEGYPHGPTPPEHTAKRRAPERSTDSGCSRSCSEFLGGGWEGKKFRTQGMKSENANQAQQHTGRLNS